MSRPELRSTCAGLQHQSTEMSIKFAVMLLALVIAANVCIAADVNTADQATLESIKGIGPDLSTKILHERSKAAFKDWSDFRRRVKGLGTRNAEKLSAAGLTVNGAMWQDAVLPNSQTGSAR
jgi:competence protein ComEA